MSYTEIKLKAIPEKTDHRCHLCRERLYLEDYNQTWEVDHSRPRARGGSDSMLNLFPACKSCNRSKQDRSSGSYRRRKGYAYKPLSSKKRGHRGVFGGLVGLLLGSAVGAPFLGGLAGWLLGRKDPD